LNVGREQGPPNVALRTLDAPPERGLLAQLVIEREGSMSRSMTEISSSRHACSARVSRMRETEAHVA
jgi:hypothetical protein